MCLEWTTLTTNHLDGARHSSAFAKEGDECFLIGGVTSDDKPSEESDSVVLYNYVTEQWTRRPNLPEPRTWCAAAAIDNTRLVVVGGFPLIEDTNSTLSSSSSLTFLYPPPITRRGSGGGGLPVWWQTTTTRSMTLVDTTTTCIDTKRHYPIS